MAADFNPEDKYSWFFGPLSREETNEMLMPEKDGLFLVRESQSIKGDFVLCVREDSKVSHYIINRIQRANILKYRIGEQEFTDMPSLLGFYKTHYLDTSNLIRPATREKVKCKYDFPGRDPEDMPFKKGEILEIITKDEDKWWTARNSEGQMGQIPVPYVERIPNDAKIDGALKPDYTTPHSSNLPVVPPEIQLPAQAVVIQDRTPNAYDKTQLKLEKGDIVTVRKMHPNGQWFGEVKGKEGTFPFTHVRLSDPNNPDDGAGEGRT